LSRLSNRTFALLLAALSLFAVFFELGREPIIEDNEGQRAVPPVEMLRNGDFVTPTINDLPYIVKPPLLYWAIAGVYAATGAVNEWTARLPTALGGVLLVLAVYAFARKRAGELAARWAALGMLTVPYFLERARWANIDILFSLALLLSMWGLYAAFAKEGRGRGALAAAASVLAFGAAMLLKGPPALLFLPSAWLAYEISQSASVGRALRHGLAATAACFFVGGLLWGMDMARVGLGMAWLPAVEFPVALTGLIFAWLAIALIHRRRDGALLRLVLLLIVIGGGTALALPWAFSLLRALGWEYIEAMLGNQVLERTYTASAINSGSPLFYVIGLLGIAAPWSFLFPLHFFPVAWRQANPFVRFCTATAWLSIAFFSLIAGKENEYILPVVPLLLIVCGSVLAAFEEGRLVGPLSKWIRVWHKTFTVLLIVVLVGVAVYYTATERSLLLYIELWVLAAAGVAGAVLLGKDAGRAPLRIFVLTLAAALVFLTGRAFHYRLDEQRSPVVLGRALRAMVDEGLHVEATPRLYPVEMFQWPALAFYLRRPLELEAHPEAVTDALAAPAPYFYVTRQDFVEQWMNMASVPEARVLLGPFTSKDIVVVSNSPLPDLKAVRRAQPPQ
jgi:4-amino-4-deoxy-L-arabinose transferase-like glycosyltransferase